MCAPASTPCADRRERARQPRAGRPAGDRPDEVLAGHGQQQRALERVQRARARAATRPSAPASCRSPDPGRASAARSPRRARAPARSARCRNRSTSVDDPAVERRVEQLLLRRRARVHQHQAGARLGAHVGELRVAQPADVVDDRRAGGDRRAARRRACRCRPRRARRARPASRSISGTTRSTSSAGVDRGRFVTPDSPPMSITSAPAREQRARELHALARALRVTPASENESGVALTIPISHGRPPSVERRAGRAQLARRRDSLRPRPALAAHAADPLGGRLLLEPRDLRLDPRARPSRARPPSARATRSGASAPGRASRAAGQQPEPGPAQQHVADARGPARGGLRTTPRRGGRAARGGSAARARGARPRRASTCSAAWP